MVEDDTRLGADTGFDGGDAEAGIALGDGPTARKRVTKPGVRRGHSLDDVD